VRLARPLSTIVLAFGATTGLLQRLVPSRYNLGPEGRWWEVLRRAVSGVAARMDERAGPRAVVRAEYAGRLNRAAAATEQWLWDAGFVRNPFARLKVRDGEPELGSWVYRESPLAQRQLHLMLFECEDGSIDIYAHAELSSIHPVHGPAHFRGDGQSVGVGVRRARRLLPLDVSDALADPPDVPWSVAAHERTDG